MGLGLGNSRLLSGSDRPFGPQRSPDSPHSFGHLGRRSPFLGLGHGDLPVVHGQVQGVWFRASTQEEARLTLIKRNLPEMIMIDCAHANSMKKYQGQPVVWKSVIGQCIDGNEALIGLMLESNLREGHQTFTGDPSSLRYGVSITDECISWETTEELLLCTDAQLQQTDLKKFQLA